MAVGSVAIVLQASFADGRGVRQEDFHKPLQLAKEDEVETSYGSGKQWESGGVCFAPVRLRDFSSTEEPSEEFFKEVARRLIAIAGFLERRPTAVFQRFQSDGLKVRILIDVWMNQDQMEVDLPCELLIACARHGLGISLISNDISAAEAAAFLENERS